MRIRIAEGRSFFSTTRRRGGVAVRSVSAMQRFGRFEWEADAPTGRCDPSPYPFVEGEGYSERDSFRPAGVGQWSSAS
jgi:hypothetical protein